ncbi:MAG: phenylacetate--CoA ligase family protein [Patescibacteria group bacterium]|nr:phenylacetate--CoA ligase family protein [Patescibacteria group bacterium]
MIRSTKWYLNMLKKMPSSYWKKRGEDFAIQYFHEIAQNTPAYKRFLKDKKINFKKIKHLNDFKDIPLINKKNYLKKYNYKDLFKNGSFSDKHWVISSTSGSTGEPFYFPRSDEQDLQYALTAELYLITNFNIDKKTTLYINGFAMGVWIGGLFTYQAIKHVVSENKYKISIINPGINKNEIIKAFKKLGPYFDQVIIGGYPPFIKDLIDYGNENNVDWHKQTVKFIFSAEGFSEDFRDYIMLNTGLKNIYLDTLNHYGTVDIGTKSYETPISILVRRLALKNKELYKSLFGNIYKLPTFTQYIPEHFYFEAVNGELVCTSRSGLPLVRYNLLDNGGVYDFDEIITIFNKHNIDLIKEAKKVGIYNTIWKIPFVYLYERSDMSVTFYGANIYPETIKKVLESSIFNKFFTGKCTLEIKHDKRQNQIFTIHIELKNNIIKSKVNLVNLKSSIVEYLIKENSEYKNNYEQLDRLAIPKIIFWSNGHDKYFKPTGKQKWVKK